MDERGMVNTDIPTIENFFTKHVPAQAPVRLQNDGPFDANRRYAPDDAPGAACVLAIATLPQGFGRYANGLMVLYATEVLADVARELTPGQFGYLNGIAHEGGRWTLKYSRAFRVAVHELSADPDGYATGWEVLNWKAEYQPQFTFGGGATAAYLTLGRYATSINAATFSAAGWQPTGAIAAQRLGEYVFFSFNIGFTEPKDYAGGDYDISKTFRLTPGLEVVDIPLDGNSALAPQEMMLSEGTDPTLWVFGGALAGQITASDLLQGGNQTPIASATLCRLRPTGTVTVNGDAGSGYDDQRGVCHLVRPFASKDYAPPEMWCGMANSDGSIDFYRSRWVKGQWVRPYEASGSSRFYDDGNHGVDPNWLAGRTRYPELNPDGYAFEPRWRTPQHHISRTGALPNYEHGGSIDWRIFRDENQDALVLAILDQGGIRNFPAIGIDSFVDSSSPYTSGGPDLQYGGGEIGFPGGVRTWVNSEKDPRPSQMWTCVSFDDGKTWSEPLQVTREMRPRSGAWATQWAQWQGASGLDAHILDLAWLDVAGNLLMGVVETYIYALPASQAASSGGDLPGDTVYPSGVHGAPIGGRVPFYTGPDDAGARVTLYVPFSSATFGQGNASRDAVTYVKPKVAS